VYLNRYRRSMRAPRSLGACVRNGSAGLSNHAGMGDCLYLDFCCGFFAVADGSDRNTSASREFMGMFSRMLTNKLFLSARKVYSVQEIVTFKEQLIVEAEKLLVEFSFRDSCTFTGVLLLKTTEKIIAVILHMGDSVLISCNLRLKTARQFTRSNFWMVGRSQHFFQIEDMPVDRDIRLLLATDGIRDIPVKPWNSQEELILELFDKCNADDIPDRLVGRLKDISRGRDDLAIIAVDPSSLADSSGRFILGGTSAHEERVFQDERNRGLYQDQFILHEPEKNCADFVDVL
jgi:serine/threonine protein phosphatase PrpC